jgi:hypothetical protein
MGRNPKKNKEYILYYIQIGSIFKIGITSLGTLKRYYAEDRDKIKIIKEWKFKPTDDINECWFWEQNIKAQFKQYRYRGEHILRGTGTTEMFTCDVLKNYDYNLKNLPFASHSINIAKS